MEDSEQIVFNNIHDIEQYVEDYVYQKAALPPNILLELEITPELFLHLKDLDGMSVTSYSVVYFTVYMPVMLTCPPMRTQLARILWE